MNKQERKLFMERLIVLVNGIAGAIVGFCTFILILIVCAMNDIYPLTLAGSYLFLIGLPILTCSVGFYLAVRKDWWIMKRRW